MLGTRGVPASYSGFETCVEELGSRLVQRGHDVTVYCRSHHITYDQPTYHGMRLVKLPTVANKYLDTIVHSFHLQPARAAAGLRYQPLLHRRQQPGDVDAAAGRPEVAAQRGRAGLEAREVAAAGQALHPVRRAHVHRAARRHHHRQPGCPALLRAGLRRALDLHRLRRGAAAPFTGRDAGALRAGAAALRAVRGTAGAGELRASPGGRRGGGWTPT